MGYRMFFLSLMLFALNSCTFVRSQSQTYIVHIDHLPSTPTLSSLIENLDSYYQQFLPTTVSISTSADEPRILYSYHNVFKGFSARLTPEQVRELETKPGVISVRPQETLSLHTTHSPNFLGLNQNMGLWRDSNYGRGMIIGVLDSGVNPNHPSFGDHGMPPPPARWRGRCEFNPTSLCNNKLIGARSFSIGSGTPYDENGHGTHTASTVAGNFVPGANIFGNANGTAAGVAPLAHIAIYKVCNTSCSESDILAAMDAAIEDGVDVISLSLGGNYENFYTDNVALGAFTAVERGIFVSASVGNNGPTPETIQNGAPWILTVGASSTDRKLRAVAVLGDNQELSGESSFQPSDFPSTLLPLVYPGFGSNNVSDFFCTPQALQNVDVRRRIVVCDDGLIERMDKGRAVRDAGGSAMIIINLNQQGYTTHSLAHVLPATHLSYTDGLRVVAYVNSTSQPMATISFRGTIIGDDRAPVIEDYSSRGPNTVSPGILKPDIIGPGANILAAWHVSVENNSNSVANFNTISGTSMSCPHLSGAAALIKSIHPDWSPAAIKSSLMTTADLVNLAQNPIEDEFHGPAGVLSMGSGHVNIRRAADPGLVYNIQSEDYVLYLCGLNYTDAQIGIIINRPIRCSEISSIQEAELNYPSFSVFLGNESQTYSRTVTNVGESNSVYTVGIDGLRFVDVRIEPNVLRFTGLNQNLTYHVTFSSQGNAPNGTTDEGHLTWTSGAYSVRSPVFITFLYI